MVFGGNLSPKMKKLSDSAVDSASKICEKFEKDVSSKYKNHVEKDPEFFKEYVIHSTCLAHLMGPYGACIISSLKTIAEKSKGVPKDKANAVVKQEQASMNRCLDGAILDIKVKLEDAAVDRQKAQVLMKTAGSVVKGPQGKAKSKE